MGTRRVAPTAIITGLREVGWTKVCRSHKDGRVTRLAPSRVVGTLDFKARAAAQAAVEESRTQSRSVYSVALTVQIPVPTGTTY